PPIVSSLRTVLTDTFKDSESDWSDFKLCLIRGGITNALFRATTTSTGQPESVVIRVYGTNTELLIDRDRERHISEELSRYEFGKQVYGYFVNGRVEEYMH